MDHENKAESDLIETSQNIIEIDSSLFESPLLSISDIDISDDFLNLNEELNDFSTLNPISTETINSISLSGSQLFHSGNRFTNNSLEAQVYNEAVEIILPSYPSTTSQNICNSESSTTLCDQLDSQSTSISCQRCRELHTSSTLTQISSIEIQMRSRDEFCNSFYKSNKGLSSISSESTQSTAKFNSTSGSISGLSLTPSSGIPLGFEPLLQYRRPADPIILKQNSSIAQNSNDLSARKTKQKKPNFEQRLEALQDENYFLKEYINYIETELNACKKKFLEFGCNPRDIDNYLELKLSENTDKKS